MQDYLVKEAEPEAARQPRVAFVEAFGCVDGGDGIKTAGLEAAGTSLEASKVPAGVGVRGTC